MYHHKVNSRPRYCAYAHAWYDSNMCHDIFSKISIIRDITVLMPSRRARLKSGSHFETNGTP